MKLKPKSAVGNNKALLYRRYNDIEMSIKLNTLYQTSDTKKWFFDSNSNSFVEYTLTTTSVPVVYIKSYNILISGNNKYQYLNGEWITPYEQEQIPTEYELEDLSFVSGVVRNIEIFESQSSLLSELYVLGATKLSLKNECGELIRAQIRIVDTNGELIYGTSEELINNNATKEWNIGYQLDMNKLAYVYIRVTCYTTTDTAKLTITSTRTISDSALKFGKSQKYQLNKYYYVGNFDYMLRGGVDTEDVQYIKGAITPTRTMDIRWFNDDLKIDHDDLVVVDGRLWIVDSVSWDIKRMPKPFKIYFGTLTSIL